MFIVIHGLLALDLWQLILIDRFILPRASYTNSLDSLGSLCSFCGESEFVFVLLVIRHSVEFFDCTATLLLFDRDSSRIVRTVVEEDRSLHLIQSHFLLLSYPELPLFVGTFR